MEKESWVIESLGFGFTLEEVRKTFLDGFERIKLDFPDSNEVRISVAPGKVWHFTAGRSRYKLTYVHLQQREMHLLLEELK